MNLAAELALIQRLLGQHGDAVREGDAEAALALAGQLRERLAPVVRAMPKVSGPVADMIRSLRDQCIQTQAMLARRQAGVDRALAALSSGTAGGELQSQRVYSAQGTLGATPWRSRGFARA